MYVLKSPSGNVWTEFVESLESRSILMLLEDHDCLIDIDLHQTAKERYEQMGDTLTVIVQPKESYKNAK